MLPATCRRWTSTQAETGGRFGLVDALGRPFVYMKIGSPFSGGRDVEVEIVVAVVCALFVLL